jgi:hypothetical protein
MAPSTTGNVIRYGVNYASGAAGILDSSGYAFVRNLETQSRNLLAEIRSFPAWCQRAAPAVLLSYPISYIL